MNQVRGRFRRVDWNAMLRWMINEYETRVILRKVVGSFRKGIGLQKELPSFITSAP